jgi:hypothetical protein
VADEGVLLALTARRVSLLFLCATSVQRRHREEALGSLHKLAIDEAPDAERILFFQFIG